MKRSGWDPVRRGRIYCSPACGHGCTHDSYLCAKRESSGLASKLGDGWSAEVWENLGWHWMVKHELGINLRKVDTGAAAWSCRLYGTHATGRSPASALRALSVKAGGLVLELHDRAALMTLVSTVAATSSKRLSSMKVRS